MVFSSLPSIAGIKEVAFINTLATCAKIIPIFVFIAILIMAFKKRCLCLISEAGPLESHLFRSIFSQSSTMLVTVFVFLGIEGASIYRVMQLTGKTRWPGDRIRLYRGAVLTGMLVTVSYGVMPWCRWSLTATLNGWCSRKA